MVSEIDCVEQFLCNMTYNCLLYNYCIMNQNELEKYASTYSVERLEAFIYSKEDTIEDVKLRYNQNVKISQSLYPELCSLEIILRNAINTALKSKISATWLEDEIKVNTLLKEEDYKLLISTYKSTIKECKSNNKPLTMGKIIASVIAKKLYAIRKLRNRIFHYEQIFRYPQKTLALYNDIIEVLSYLPSDKFAVLESNSNFLNVYNDLMALQIKNSNKKT